MCILRPVPQHAPSCSFSLPSATAPGVLWLLGFCPIDEDPSEVNAALGSLHSSFQDYFTADSVWTGEPLSPGEASDVNGYFSSFSGGASGSEAPAGSTGGVGAEEGGCRAVAAAAVEGEAEGGRNVGQLVLSMPLLAAEQPVAAEAARLLANMLMAQEQQQAQGGLLGAQPAGTC